MPPPPPLRNPPTPAARYRQLGTVSLVLAVIELLFCVQKLLTALFSKSINEATRTLVPQVPNGPSVKDMMDAARELAERTALWEALRTVPFLVATGFLVWIALRLREGDARALYTARRWTLWAFGAIAVSLVIQAVWTLPATMEYQHRIAGMMPTIPTGGSSPPIDMKEMMSTITAFSVVFGVVMGTACFAAWPIVLRVWAGRLIRETLGEGR